MHVKKRGKKLAIISTYLRLKEHDNLEKIKVPASVVKAIFNKHGRAGINFDGSAERRKIAQIKTKLVLENSINFRCVCDYI